MKKITKEVMVNIANFLGESIMSGNPKEKIVERLREDLGPQEWDKYSREELRELGFCDWDGGGLLLAPPFMLQLTKEGFELDSISGEIIKFNKKLDCDSRFGVSSYGVYKTGEE